MVLRDGLAPLAYDVTRLVLGLAHQRPSVRIIARECGTTPRQLERRFRAGGLPHPKRLITLARWLPIATELANGEYDTRQCVLDFGFANVSTLYKAVSREVHMTVSDLRSGAAICRLVGDLVTAYQTRERVVGSNT